MKEIIDISTSAPSANFNRVIDFEGERYQVFRYGTNFNFLKLTTNSFFAECLSTEMAFNSSRVVSEFHIRNEPNANRIVIIGDRFLDLFIINLDKRATKIGLISVKLFYQRKT